MPIYEYACQNCGKRTEAIQRVGERPLKICPHCGGRLKKLASAPAIQFKGSGWYVTDYAGGGRGGREKAEKAEKAEKGDKAEKAEKAEKADSSEKPAEKKKESKEKKTAKD